MKRVLKFAAVLLLLTPCFAQRQVTGKYPLSGSGMISFTPAQLGVNALTEPGSGTTALSTIVDTTGARALTLKFSCTQGAITVNVQTYDTDGATLLGLYAPLSAVAAATKTDLYISTEQDIQSSSGTLGVKIRFPQQAIAFSFTNASASAGTCTASLFITF